MRTLMSSASSLVAPVALLAALSYSQYGWRRDRQAYADLRQHLVVVSQQRNFPADGEDINSNPMRVIRGKDTVSLAELVRGHRSIVYFGRPGCSTCEWFETKMDSILPTWRDSMLIVTSYGETRGPVVGLTLDSASSALMTGVPAMIVVDSAGLVRHSVVAGLPPVTHVLNFIGMPAPSDPTLLGGFADSVALARAARKSGDTSTAHAK